MLASIENELSMLSFTMRDLLVEDGSQNGPTPSGGDGRPGVTVAEVPIEVVLQLTCTIAFDKLRTENRDLFDNLNNILATVVHDI